MPKEPGQPMLAPFDVSLMAQNVAGGRLLDERSLKCGSNGTIWEFMSDLIAPHLRARGRTSIPNNDGILP
jgi:hypothetical protein